MRSNFLLAALLLAGCVDASLDDSDTPPSDDGDDISVRAVIEPNDTLGDHSVAGDFNGDGFMDLAMSATGETVSGKAGSGAVAIYYGSLAGLSLTPDKVYTVASFGKTPHAADHFGASLAARNMGGDQAWELVVGAPGFWATNASGTAIENSGAVFTFTAAHDVGLTPANVITERAAGGSVEQNDNFGSAVAMGSYNGTTSEVAVGASGEIPGGTLRTGWVTIMSWSGSLLVGVQNISPPAGTIGGALFGASLATIHYGSPAVDDLAIGAPGDSNGGTVHWYKGYTNPFAMMHNQTLAGGGAGFGSVIVAGTFHKGGKPDLAITSPATTTFPALNPGSVIIYNQNATSHQYDYLQQIAPPTIFPMKFGSALAACDLDLDGADELAVGAPNAAVGSTRGQVYLYQGSTGTNDLLSMQGSPLSIHVETYSTGGFEAYGSAIALADFRHPMAVQPGMAVGAPGATVHGNANAGLIDEYTGTGALPSYWNTHTEAAQ